MARNIDRIINESICRMINEKELRQCMTRRSVVDKIMDAVKPYTSRLYHDEYWQGKLDVFDALDKLGVEYECYVKGGGYTDNPGGGQTKTYNFKITVECENGKVFEIPFVLVMCQAGSIEDPWERYDMCFYPTD